MVATRLLLLRCACAPIAVATRSLCTALGAQQQQPMRAAVRTIGARSFSLASSNGGKNDKDNDEDDDDLDVRHDRGLNGDVNPFERLLQHSQQFRQQMADAEQSGGALVEELELEEADEEEEEKVTTEEAVDADDDSDSDSDSDDDDDEDNEDANAAGQRFSQRTTDSRSRRPPPASAGAFDEHRAARAARSVKRRILSAPEDELDYEHELSKAQYSAGKERKYQQLLHREQDKDRVCRNCGERGHVAKHCLLPMICSNCGGIGHRMRNCIYPDYASGGESLAGVSAGSKKKQQAVVEKQRMGMRYDKFKEEFDSQIEEYLEGSTIAAEKRSKRKAEKLAQKQQEVSQDFDPVTR